MTGPYAAAAQEYVAAGWPCVIPVPVHAKHPPPRGYTGEHGRDTQPDDIAAFIAQSGDSSVALRMPDGVIGIDVDDYEKGTIVKRGGAQQAALAREIGVPLPRTWASTARGVGPSRISFFRVPSGRYATTLGDAVEIVQRHHRYAVVAPSMHVDVGAPYVWYGPDGVATRVPSPADLADLPDAWVTLLRAGASAAGPPGAPQEVGEALFAAIAADERSTPNGAPECVEVSSAHQRGTQQLTDAAEGGRHDAMIGRVHELVHLGAAGHVGAGRALAQLEDIWDRLIDGEPRDPGEWHRACVTSANKAAVKTGPRMRTGDPCLLSTPPAGWTAQGNAVGPHASVRTAPVSRQRSPLLGEEGLVLPTWTLREGIGTHAFAVDVSHDQGVAEAVLTRMRPVLRYAFDAGTWVRRDGAVWRSSKDLTEWSLSQAATLMPSGDPDADEGTDAHAQYKLRMRMLGSTPAGGMARKMRALVAAGDHPSCIEATTIDSSARVLWAGGVAWDLEASTDVPRRADVDTSTPHLRTAKCAPADVATPLWDAFLMAVWPDADVRAWALRVLSVAVTGVADAALPILVGDTRRGKTQVVTLVMDVLGNYAHAADPRLLTSGDHAHASIVHALKGRRLSFIDESPRSSKWAQENLKRLTGGGYLTGNAMRANPITFAATHTMVLTANDPPPLTDDAVRARVRLVPCDGDVAAVRAAREAIGDLDGPAWRAEAPGVLAQLLVESARWLADRASASTAAAPGSVSGLADEMAAEQDLVGTWCAQETVPEPAGTSSRELYRAFSSWASTGGERDVPSIVKWARRMDKLGFPKESRRSANYRLLRVRGLGEDMTVPVSGPAMGVEGPAEGRGGSAPPTLHGENGRAKPDTEDCGGCGGLDTSSNTYSSSYIDTGTTRENASSTLHPPPTRVVDRVSGSPRPILGEEGCDPQPSAEPEADSRCHVVTRHGEPLACTNAQATTVIAKAVTWAGALTVDVETSGYPLGHAAYELRTVQLGNARAAVVVDVRDGPGADGARALVTAALASAPKLHAHSATADLVPLVAADLATPDAWQRMHDTVIMAKLADPAATGTAPGLKQLATAVLGKRAVSADSDKARKALFRQRAWLTHTRVVTDPQRSGWANVDPADPVMLRYAAADVLDTAALAERLPSPPHALLERERAVQRVCARVTHVGVAIAADQVRVLQAEHRAHRDAARSALAALGVDNPASTAQLGAALTAAGALLPTTAKGAPSVAADALAPLRDSETQRVAAIATQALVWRLHAQRLATYIDPRLADVEHGDGRVRPTVHTLEARTGRMSAVRPNLQNVPREGGFRSCLVADPDHVLISADLSGVELRVAAVLSGDLSLQAMLAQGVDLHTEIARAIWGPDATKAQRYIAKRVVFGHIYGGGLTTLTKQAGAPHDVVEAAVRALADAAPQLARWAQQWQQAVRSGNTSFTTYSGRTIHLPPDHPHKAPNYLIQGTARELLVDALLRWDDSPHRGGVVWPVHDEIVAMVPTDQATPALGTLVACMARTLDGVAIRAEAGTPAHAWQDAS